MPTVAQEKMAARVVMRLEAENLAGDRPLLLLVTEMQAVVREWTAKDTPPAQGGRWLEPGTHRWWVCAQAFNLDSGSQRAVRLMYPCKEGR